MNEETKTTPPPETGQRRLYRSLVNRYIAGVCGGVAEYFNVDPVVVRIIWFFSIFVHGIGIFAYIAAWIIVPENRFAIVTPPRPPKNAQPLIGAALILLGLFFLADKMNWDFMVPWHWDRYVPRWFNWRFLFSLFIIALGLMLIFRPAQDAVKPPSFAAPAGGAPETTGSFSPGQARMSEKRLLRAVDERMIGGVCAGLAKYFNIDPSFIRIGFVLMTISSGMIFGIVTYIVMMIVVPEEKPAAKNSVTPVSGT
ncbi:MAG: PspC domain-containing protein [candidate division KSB1 bacterium]|nr:PspC domain-containing protein [candidate division KSB1 bacterium]MDZ7368732.1 PspC domain-containing protein [candidate division KSB1 bacterium]MDZ7406451.1 PspC domain-containing protein [candidate division KSB1 bacterium]